MTAVSTLETPAARRPRDHIVDLLIAERAPTLSRSWVWPVARPALYAILSYGKARRMADQIAPLLGRQALDAVSELLSLRVRAAGLEHLPPDGRVVIIANHPTGIADGIALYDAVRTLRPDICFYANSDAHRVAPRFDEVLIPVEWVEAKRTRERTRMTLQLTREAMEAERALAIFPAGRLARVRGGVLRDPEWMTSAVSIARKYEAPVLPVHVSGPRSTLFHLFDKVSGELRDITLFHELLNKHGRRFALQAGPLIAPEAMAGDAGEVSERIKAYIEDVLPPNARQALRVIRADGDFRLDDEAATARLGAAIARVLAAGEAVCLSGPLGAGKSTLARGLIRARTTPDEDAPSPTFTLIQTYEADGLLIAHLDLYRLTSPDEAYEIGLDEALDEGAAVIEWPERLEGRLPPDRLDIDLAFDGESRRARLTGHGAWEGRAIDYGA